MTLSDDEKVLVELFSGLSEELARWAEAGENLQHLAGKLLAERPDSHEALVEVQQLDALVQHIEQMGALCGRLSTAAAANGGRLDRQRVLGAAASLSLGALSERFGEAGASAWTMSDGDCELW